MLPRKRKASRFAFRTRWFDDRLLEALAVAGAAGPAGAAGAAGASGTGSGSDGRGDGGRGESSLAGTAAAAATRVGGGGAAGEAPGAAAPASRQVVLLGAGMDTRAWRLPLPAGECASVAKRSSLDGMNAHLSSTSDGGACFGPEPLT